jgi:hypothetical protein
MAIPGIVLIVSFIISVWLIAMSGVALHESSQDAGESYETFVKWFAGISVSVGCIAFIYTFYEVYKNWKFVST